MTGTGLLLRLAAMIVIGAIASACGSAAGKAPQIVDARDATPVIVATDRGKVEGTAAAAGRAFLGIPFAAPPVGPLRFAPPRPASAWTGIRPATALGNACPTTVGGGSEDCLNLNVYTPRDMPADGRLPVMVWLYGGGLTFGANGQYDGSALARRRHVVVVVPNYRLGALGFLAHPALEGPGEGDYGILDQRLALRWVQRNIAAFGGDPGRVTLFGESAGSLGACTHMAAPGSRGLFHRVILESDTCIFPDQSIRQAEAERGGREMAADLGCGDPATVAACLRALPVGKLMRAKSRRWGNTGRDGWSPMVGGDVLPSAPRDVFARRQAAPVPLLMGSNHDEGRLFANLIAPRLGLGGRAGYEKAVRDGLMPGLDQAVLAEYEPEARASRYEAYADIVTDSHFACPMLTLHRLRAGVAPDYVYEFDDPDAPAAIPTLPFAPRQGSYHSSELIYVFQHKLLFADPARWSPAQRDLSDRMQAYWGAFAASGRPAAEPLPAWPVFDGRRPLLLAPGRAGLAGDFATRHHCAFWNAHGY